MQVQAGPPEGIAICGDLTATCAFGYTRSIILGQQVSHLIHISSIPPCAPSTRRRAYQPTDPAMKMQRKITGARSAAIARCVLRGRENVADSKAEIAPPTQRTRIELPVRLMNVTMARPKRRRIARAYQKPLVIYCHPLVHPAGPLQPPSEYTNYQTVETDC